MHNTRKPVWDDDTRAVPPHPKSQKPMSSRHRAWAIVGSIAAAVGIHTTISNSILQKKGQNIAGMQNIAEEQGSPVVVTETIDTIRAKVTEAITGKEEPQNTIIINPPGVTPAIQVVTPEVTITADKQGEIEKIIPKESATEPLPTPKEAQSTVDDALKDAAKKTLPKEEKPILPPPIKID